MDARVFFGIDLDQGIECSFGYGITSHPFAIEKRRTGTECHDLLRLRVGEKGIDRLFVCPDIEVHGVAHLFEGEIGHVVHFGIGAGIEDGPIERAIDDKFPQVYTYHIGIADVQGHKREVGVGEERFGLVPSDGKHVVSLTYMFFGQNTTDATADAGNENGFHDAPLDVFVGQYVIMCAHNTLNGDQMSKHMHPKEHKTLDQRIDRIYKMAKGHFGEVRFVGIKRHTKIGWVAKIQFDEFDSLIAEGENASDALRNLRKRLRKIIDRYNMV